MQVRVSTKEGIPIYLQIINQIKYMVASGRLTPGDKLPPVRRLAEQLLINPNTVARAYRELETVKVLNTRQGSGVSRPWPDANRPRSSENESTCSWQRPGRWILVLLTSLSW